jgi:hypothetical protein
LDLDPRVQTHARAQTRLEHKHTHKHDKHGCTCVQRDEGKLVVRTSDAVLLRASGLRAGGGCGRAKSGTGSVGGTKRESKRRADPRASMHTRACIAHSNAGKRTGSFLVGWEWMGTGKSLHKSAQSGTFASKRQARLTCAQCAAKVPRKPSKCVGFVRAWVQLWIFTLLISSHLISSHLISP